MMYLCRQNTSLELYLWYKSGVQCKFWGCQGSNKDVLYLFGVAWTCICFFYSKNCVRLVDSKIKLLKCSFCINCDVICINQPYVAGCFIIWIHYV